MAREALAALAAFTAAAIVWTWPLVRYITIAVPSDLGDPLSLAFKLGWVADRLAHGLRGFWDAPIFFPYAHTFAYSEHVLGIGLFTAPVYWLSGGNPLLTYNVAFLFSYVLAGAGMYLLARSLTGRRDAAILAALAFAFGPHRVGRLSHLQVLMSGWMPIGLWALHRYFSPQLENDRRRRYLSLGAFVLAFLLQGLSNGYFLYYFCIPAGFVVIDGLVRSGSHWVRRTAELMVAGAIILAMLAPFAVAYLQVQAESGLVRSDQDILNYSADVASYGQVSDRVRVWRGVLRRAPIERELFPGATMVALAAVAIGALAFADRRTKVPRHQTARNTFLYASIAAAGFVLSLGPQPEAWGMPIAGWGPYTLLLDLVPGMSGLRVTARISIIVFLALSVLMAIGAARLLERVPAVPRRILTVALAVAILAEGFIGPMPVAAFSPLGNDGDRRAYAWLTTQPEGGVLELPLAPSVASPFTFHYQFAALVHKHPIVNGYTGHQSALQDFLHGAGSPLFDPAAAKDALSGLRLIGVRYVVLHSEMFEDAADAARITNWMDGEGDAIAQRRNFDTTIAWQLSDTAAGRVDFGRQLREVPRDAFELQASVQQERLANAVDGDIETRWLSGRRQSGNEWIEVRFKQPTDVARLRIDVAPRSFGDYPRELVVESVDASGSAVRVYRGRVLPLFLQGMAYDPYRAPTVVDLPANQTSILRLLQVGETRTFFWSLHELKIFDRD